MARPICEDGLRRSHAGYGIEPQICKIVNKIPNERQTLMYTATWPKEVCKIAANLLVDPVQVNNGNTDELAANKSITQQFMGTSLKVNGTLSFFSFGQGRLLFWLPLMWLHEGLTLKNQDDDQL